MFIATNASLRPYNSFHIDAKADRLVRLESPEQVPQVLALRAASPGSLVLGGGSNVLLRGNFDGLVILNTLRGRRLLDEDTDTVVIEAGAGENWHDFVRWCIGRGYYGLENLSLIPGNVGAAPIQNIGAYGVELAWHFISLDAVDLESGKNIEFDNGRCRFGYRDSVFKSRPDRYLITAVRLRLLKTLEPQLGYDGVVRALEKTGADPANPSALQISDAICALRSEKLPLPGVIGNAGSFFKNPVIGADRYSGLKERHPSMPGYCQAGGMKKIPAAWLIEQCGWKGYREGDAGVYGKHALVLVNHGSAGGGELFRLACRIRDSVMDRFGILLEPEPRII